MDNKIEKFKDFKQSIIKDATIFSTATFMVSNEVLNYVATQDAYGVCLAGSFCVAAFCSLAFLYVYKNEVKNNYADARKELKSQNEEERSL